ncbi:uncharacterized protein TNCT_460291 [Trichonephila clavata]|uniref:Uncharacterized protein n=1 Tax=Trichonephila clavata TaxID=2740835 RepID=A0A8X6FZS2_TRICU|nr:uncharacterized protein TNCT_460291 [Trichonephila clavata]
MDYFPQNTQSFYRTKLSHPLLLLGDWEVALSEICIPRNWFNIGNHNNFYTILLEEERNIIQEEQPFEIKFKYETNDPEIFFKLLNRQIATHVGENVKFSFKANKREVELFLGEGYQIHLQYVKSSNFLHILSLGNHDPVINVSKTFRPPLQLSNDFSFVIMNTNPLSGVEHIIPVIPHHNKNAIPKTPKQLLEAFRENIKLLRLEHLIHFIYNDITSDVDIHLAKNIEVHLTQSLGKSLLEKLNLKKDIILKGITSFKVNRAHPIDKNDHFKIVVKEYFEKTDVFKQKHDLFLNIGMYKTEKELLDAFHFVTLTHLQNSHVAIEVPPHVKLILGQGLADLLGYSETEMTSGSYTGK